MLRFVSRNFYHPKRIISSSLGSIYTVSKEPVYYEVIPGNVIDKTAFIQILDRFDVKNAIIIVDKGFNTKENIAYLQENNIKYIVPYNDSSKQITDILEKNDYQSVFSYSEKTIKAMKVKQDNSFYYLYQDPYIAANQESNYIKRISNNKAGCDINKLNEKKNKFGVIFFSSNINTDDLFKIYSYYKQR